MIVRILFFEFNNATMRWEANCQICGKTSAFISQELINAGVKVPLWTRHECETELN